MFQIKAGCFQSFFLVWHNIAAYEKNALLQGEITNVRIPYANDIADEGAQAWNSDSYNKAWLVLAWFYLNQLYTNSESDWYILAWFEELYEA